MNKQKKMSWPARITIFSTLVTSLGGMVAIYEVFAKDKPSAPPALSSPFTPSIETHGDSSPVIINSGGGTVNALNSQKHEK